MDKFL